MAPFGYGTGDVCIEYDYGTTSAATTGSSIWQPYTTGSTAATATIKYGDATIKYSDCDAYTDLMDQTAKVAWKVKYGYGDDTCTADDWNSLVNKAYKLTGSTWTSSSSSWVDCRPVVKSPHERMREMIRSRQAPMILTKRTHMPTATDVREMRARETLLRVLGEDKFKRFLKHGFVSVTAKSGLVYQIFPGHGITNVYDQGEKVERLCVVLKGNFPPTDSLIMRYLLILNDERDFRKHAIEHQVIKPRSEQPAIIKTPESLNAIWSKLKVA